MTRGDPELGPRSQHRLDYSEGRIVSALRHRGLRANVSAARLLRASHRHRSLLANQVSHTHGYEEEQRNDQRRQGYQKAYNNELRSGDVNTLSSKQIEP